MLRYFAIKRFYDVIYGREANWHFMGATWLLTEGLLTVYRLKCIRLTYPD